MNKNNITWENVEEFFNSLVKKLSSDSAVELLVTPELVREYISKYELSSDSAVELLVTPELVREYISKYRLYSDSAEIKLLSTPELVREYISKYEVNKFLFGKIIKKHKQ